MSARWVERRTKGAVAIAPWQTFPQRMRDAGLTAEDGDKKVWAITPEGEVKGGAAAINAAMAHAWWAKPFTLLYRLPGLRQLEDIVYHWVTTIRHRLPGVTPACEERDDCQA